MGEIVGNSIVPGRGDLAVIKMDDGTHEIFLNGINVRWELSADEVIRYLCDIITQDAQS